MDTPIGEYCRIGIVHFMLWKEGLKGEVDLNTVKTILDDPFFEAIEMSWVKDAATRAAVAREIEDYGKRLGFGAQPILLTQQLDLNHAEWIGGQATSCRICCIHVSYYKCGKKICDVYH